VWWITRQLYRAGTDTTIADDHTGDTLAQLGQHVWLLNDRQIIVRVYIDKARRQHQAPSVDNTVCGGVNTRSNMHHALIVNSHVGLIGFCTRAVHHLSVANQRVILHNWPTLTGA